MDEMTRGTVVGYEIRVLPRKTERTVFRGKEVTVVKKEKVATYIAVQVDGRRVYTIPSLGTDHIGEDGIGHDDMLTVYNKLLETHPIGSEKQFCEIQSRRDNRTLYRLVEEVE